jgi:hypothetical protein
MSLSCDTALERNISGKQIILLAPANNVLSNDAVHTFYWERLDGATDYEFEMVFPKFDSMTRLFIDTILTTNKLTLNLTRNSYQWRVRARNNNSISQTSEIRNLIIN